MKIFGLYPDQDGEAAATHDRFSLTNAIIYASLSFGLVSVLAYSIWAFRLVPGRNAMYATIAIVYICLSGLALSRLIAAPKAWIRFSSLFAIGFLIYAIFWCLLIYMI